MISMSDYYCFFSLKFNTIKQTSLGLNIVLFLERLKCFTWHRGFKTVTLGRSPKARLYHCTPVWLTLAIAPNVGDSGALIMVVR